MPVSAAGVILDLESENSFKPRLSGTLMHIVSSGPGRSFLHQSEAGFIKWSERRSPSMSFLERNDRALLSDVPIPEAKKAS